MKTWLVVVVSILATAIIVGGGLYYYLNQKSETDKNNLQSQIDDLVSQSKSSGNTVDATNDTNLTAGWKTYSNTVYGFSIKYPKEWSLVDNGTDIIFQQSTSEPLIVRIYSGNNDGHGGATYFEVARNIQRTYSAGIADEFLFPNGNGFGETKAYVTERFIKNNVVYAFEFYNITSISDQDNLVLGSLQFTK